GKEDIARFNRERAAQNVVRDSMAAYYLKAANESLGDELTALSKELDAKLEALCKNIPANNKSTPVLLDKCDSGLAKVHAIAGVRSTLAKADVNLAALIRVDPKHHIAVQPPSFADPRPLQMNTEELVEYALSHRPELLIEQTNINNERIEEQRARSKVLPGVEIGVTQNTTDN
ncbi:MAG: hypothetical protein GY694_16645, partial [Gammaproteobacteria bacterium]|nr:hypothetical protein [Gammaproteobacteria bacterium]